MNLIKTTLPELETKAIINGLMKPATCTPGVYDLSGCTVYELEREDEEGVKIIIAALKLSDGTFLCTSSKPIVERTMLYIDTINVFPVKIEVAELKGANNNYKMIYFDLGSDEQSTGR